MEMTACPTFEDAMVGWERGKLGGLVANPRASLSPEFLRCRFCPPCLAALLLSSTSRDQAFRLAAATAVFNEIKAAAKVLP